jgi:phosphoribosyl 1,2-cyclic phosphodiesterase
MGFRRSSDPISGWSQRLPRDAERCHRAALSEPDARVTRLACAGHSTWEAGVAVADAAHVGQLVLFHHDPQRTDREVAAIEAQADIVRPGTIAAREGLVLELEARPSVRAKAA